MTLPRGITRSLGPTYTVPSYSFDLCSNCHSYSLASICPYTPLWITVHMNLPYAHLRYLFEGYRPSQTNNVTQSMPLLLSDSPHVSGIHFQSGISLLFPLSGSLPPMLHRKMNTHNATIQLRCMGSFRLPHN